MNFETQKLQIKHWIPRDQSVDRKQRTNSKHIRSQLQESGLFQEIDRRKKVERC